MAINSDLLLGVNIDHIATLRNARGTDFPNPVHAADIAERAGADGITIHLREDRRHINDNDVKLLASTINTRLNLEMAVTSEMLNIALQIKPQFVCFVPEKREELTTEGGLDVVQHIDIIREFTKELEHQGILVSLFIDPDPQQIEAAAECQASLVELHTGQYAEASYSSVVTELTRISEAAEMAANMGMTVNAGHGLNYHNVKPIAAIPQFYELNIGHAIIARSVFDGLDKAVRQMRQLMNEARDKG